MEDNDFPEVLYGRPVDPANWYNPVARAVTALRRAPGWTSYGTLASILTATSVDPDNPNGSFTAQYRERPERDEVQVRATVTIGAGFSAGTGVYRILLPITASADAVAMDLGQVYVFHAGFTNRQAVARFGTTTHVEMFIDGGASGLANSGPGGTAWSTGSIIVVNVTYQPE